MTDQPDNRLRGLTAAERQIMGNLLRQPPEQHKAAPKPGSRQGKAQRQRRQKEREAAAMASGGV